MPATVAMEPLAIRLVASAAVTATGNSGALKIPLADSYAFYLDVTAISGGDTTMDIAIQISIDRGTTFYTAARFASVVFADGAQVRRLQIQPSLGRGEAGAESAVANTGGALAVNTPLTKSVRVVWTVAGASPSITFALYCVTIPRQAGTY